MDGTAMRMNSRLLRWNENGFHPVISIILKENLTVRRNCIVTRVSISVSSKKECERKREGAMKIRKPVLRNEEQELCCDKVASFR